MQPLSELYDKAERLQNLLVSQATDGAEDDDEYQSLRQELLDKPSIAHLVPRFVKTNRNLMQFWNFIKQKFKHYAERRQFIWEEFNPLLEVLENKAGNPADQIVSGVLDKFDRESVHHMWSKALDRRTRDPEGAITVARTLLESVCKHILDEANVTYADDSELPKLYRLVSEQLHIAPSQHSEQVFKQILGSCTSVVEGLGAVRNRLGDSHGTGKKAVKPAPRHAEPSVLTCMRQRSREICDSTRARRTDA